MADTGTIICGTGANNITAGITAWGNPGNITLNDGTYATDSGTSSQYLQGTNYGFSIPLTATIDGVILTFERGRSASGTVTDNEIKLVVGGVIGLTNKSAGAGWTTTDTVATFGSSSDLWGATLTPTIVNASNFGAVIRVTGAGTPSARVDYMAMQVFYTPAGGGNTNSNFFAFM